MYLEKPISNYVETAVQTTLQIHRRERPGMSFLFSNTHHLTLAIILLKYHRYDSRVHAWYG